jgi:glutamyl-tRNA reductase
MTRQIFAAEITHDNSPFHVREKLAGDDKAVKACIHKLRQNMDEVFVLSTPNRFVIYAVGEKINPLLNYFLEDAEVFRYVQFYKNTLASVNHLFAMASGLCSQVKGEHLIVSQIKESHILSLESNGIGLRLDNLLRQAIRVGKKVRTETGIDKFCSSVVDAGFSLLYNKIENLYERNFLVIGSGEVVRLTLESLHQEGMSNVLVSCHDSKSVKALAKVYGFNTVPIDRVSEYFKEADVIIGCTNESVKTHMFMKEEEPFHPNRKRIILDFGMPRSFSDKFRYHAFTELYSLDDIKALNPTPLDAFGGVEEAWRLVSALTHEFLSVLFHLEQAPILEAYWSRLGNIKSPDAKPSSMLSGIFTSQETRWIKQYTRKFLGQNEKQNARDLQLLLGNTRPENAEELVRKIYSFHIIDINVSPN